MRIKIHQYLYQSHSWSIVGWNLARSFIALGHQVDLFPTDLDEKCHLPPDLQPYLTQDRDKDYDCQLSYTAPINWAKYLSNGPDPKRDRNRFAIWAYETSILPPTFGKFYKYTDKVLPPSNYCKDIFERGGIPAEHMVVVPHGINPSDFETGVSYQINSDKKFKIGVVIMQPHLRKNIPGVLEAYGKAFTKDDDVSLLVKINKKPNNKARQMPFYVDFDHSLAAFKKKYPNHAEVKVVSEFIPNIIEFYNSCHIIFSMSHAEGFSIPDLDGLAAKKIVVAPNYSGRLDFLNENNSLLINTKEVRTPREAQYWQSSPYTAWGNPDVNHAAELLQRSVKEYESLLNQFLPQMEMVRQKYTWENAARQILDLCQS